MKREIPGLHITVLTPGDVRLAGELLRYLQEEFEVEHPGDLSDDRVRTVLADGSTVVFAALVDHCLAGGITAYRLHGADYAQSELMLYDVAVKPEFRRRGIATAMLLYAKEWCANNGIAEMFVLADAADDHAVGLYRSVSGAVASRAVMVTYAPGK